MKKTLFGLLTIVLSLCFSSCTKTYYQVTNTKPVNPSLFASAKDNYVYEDQNVKITFDMWRLNGSRQFVIENKTDRNIYLDWEKSCELTNDRAYAINDQTNSNVKLLSPLFIIPAHKSREFANFQMVDSIYKVEGLKEKVRHSESRSFDLEETPFTFGYKITYCFDNHQDEKTIDLDFYVARLTNYSYKDFWQKGEEKVLYDGRVIRLKGRLFPTVSPKTGYYVKYYK